MDLFTALEWYTRKQHSTYSCSETYNSLDWHEDNELSKPTPEELATAWEEYVNDFKKRDYQRKRKAAYPSVEDQLDLMYHQGFVGWLKHIFAIKQKYPAPHQEVAPDLVNPMDAIDRRMTEIENSTIEETKRARQELADLQAAVIDTKGAMIAIKGFMMEIPNLKIQLDAIQATLAEMEEELQRTE
jgi:hypothetical protein